MASNVYLTLLMTTRIDQRETDVVDKHTLPAARPTDPLPASAAESRMPATRRVCSSNSFKDFWPGTMGKIKKGGTGTPFVAVDAKQIPTTECTYLWTEPFRTMASNARRWISSTWALSGKTKRKSCLLTLKVHTTYLIKHGQAEKSTTAPPWMFHISKQERTFSTIQVIGWRRLPLKDAVQQDDINVIKAIP